MKWLTSILVTLILTGCNHNETSRTALHAPDQEKWAITVETDRGGIIYFEGIERGIPTPFIQPQPHPYLSPQHTKDEPTQIQKREIRGYKVNIDRATGEITKYPVYEDEKK